MPRRATLFPQIHLCRQRRPSPVSHPVLRWDPFNMETTLDVAVYHPIDRRDPHHWAIHITTPRRTSTLHQIHDDIGGRGYYVAPICWNIRPQRARSHRVSIFIGRIPWGALNRVRRLIQRSQVNNSSWTWNCQAWVVEIIRGLERLGHLQVRERGLMRLLQLREHWQ